MRLGIIFGLLAFMVVEAVKPAPVVLRERAELREVCAEYTSDNFPRTPSRSCVEAAAVRAWILQNGRSEACH